MPSKSAEQQKLMRAVAHNPKFAKKVDIPQSVGQEFVDADKKFNITFKEWCEDLMEMTDVKKMNSHHKMGYLDGIKGINKNTSVGHEKEYDAAYRLGYLHRKRLMKIGSIKESIELDELPNN